MRRSVPCHGAGTSRKMAAFGTGAPCLRRWKGRQQRGKSPKGRPQLWPEGAGLPVQLVRRQEYDLSVDYSLEF